MGAKEANPTLWPKLVSRVPAILCLVTITKRTPVQLPAGSGAAIPPRAVSCELSPLPEARTWPALDE